MDLNMNHVFCSDPEGTEDYFSGRVILHVNKKELLSDHFTDAEALDVERYNDAIFFRKDSENFEQIKERLKANYTKTVRTLSKDTIKWLDENVQPIDGEKAYAYGSLNYIVRCHSYSDYSIFFGRITDALKFIEHFSEEGVPTFIFDYFHDIEYLYNDITKSLFSVPFRNGDDFRERLESEPDGLRDPETGELYSEELDLFNHYKAIELEWGIR